MKPIDIARAVARRLGRPDSSESPLRNRIVKMCGVALAIAAGVYFVIHAHRALAGHDLSRLLNAQVAVASVGLTTLYTASIATTGVAWWWLLKAMGQQARFTQLLPILATTQFGKYIPGNFAHHLGRIAMCRNIGLGLPAALTSVACELLLAIITSAQVGVLSLWWMPNIVIGGYNLQAHRLLILIAVMLAAVATLMIVPRTAVWWVRKRSGSASLSLSPPVPGPATIFGCYLMYAAGFVMIGCGMWLVAQALGAIGDVSGPVFFIGAFATSWILGFIMPGAPAGLGIREAVLTAWMSVILPAAEVVFLVVVLRVATTAGDLVNFLWGSYFSLKQGR